MPLSLHKLERILTSRGMIPKKYFVIHGLCVYIEVLSTANANSFLLYIPSKYKISVESGNNVYKIEEIELDQEGNIPEDYAGEPDNFELDREYEEIDINTGPIREDTEDLAKHLEENYNHPVSLKDITREDKINLRDIFRQVRRFRFCVQSIKYKLCIIYKNFICCIRKDDSLECFMIKHYPKKDIRKFMVTLDLETLYNKIDTITIDIQSIREGFYKVLDKNQLKHARNLKSMLESESKITAYSDSIYTQKQRFTEYISQLETMLTRLGESERIVIEKLIAIEEKYSDPSLSGLHTDIEKTHIVSKHETELERINTLKHEVIRNIITLKVKQEHLALAVDKIFFDNSVMLDAILKNMRTLENI